MSRRKRWWARRLALAMIGAGGLAIVVLAVLAADWQSWPAALAGWTLLWLWGAAMFCFDRDTEHWGPW